MRILVIEDEQKTALAIQEGLGTLRHEVDIIFDGKEALTKILKKKYDLLICDVLMPYINGFELVNELRKIEIDTPVIFLTALDQNDEKIKGFEVGADDYITKPFAFNELIARINAINRRFNPAIEIKNQLIFSDLVIDLNKHTVIRQSQIIDLTPKEFDLLHFLIQNQNKIVSKKEIAENVWNINFYTGTNTIEVYMNYLRNKIDKPFENKLIHTSHGLGYILSDKTIINEN